jgi:hypothetical protein
VSVLRSVLRAVNKNLNIINVTLFKGKISLKRYGMKALRLLITIRYGTLLYRLLLLGIQRFTYLPR